MNTEIFCFSSNLSKPFQVKFKYYLLFQAILVSFLIFGYSPWDFIHSYRFSNLCTIYLISLGDYKFLAGKNSVIFFHIPEQCISHCSAMCLVLVCSVVQLCPTLVTPWMVAYQAPLSVEFSKEEYWSRLPFHTPGDLPNPGIEPVSPALVGGFFTTELPGKSQSCTQQVLKKIFDKFN